MTRYELEAIHTGTAEDLNWYGGLITVCCIQRLKNKADLNICSQFDNSSALQLVDAIAHYVRDIKDPKACTSSDAHFSCGTYSSSGLGITLQNRIVNGTVEIAHFAVVLYNGGPRDSLPEEIFGELLAVPHTTVSMGPLNFTGASGVIDFIGPNPAPQLWGSSSLVGEEDLFHNAFAAWTNFTEQVIDERPSLALSLGFTVVPQSQIEASKKRGGTIFAPTDGNYAAVVIAREYTVNDTSASEKEIAASQFLFDQ